MARNSIMEGKLEFLSESPVTVRRGRRDCAAGKRRENKAVVKNLTYNCELWDCINHSERDKVKN